MFVVFKPIEIEAVKDGAYPNSDTSENTFDFKTSNIIPLLFLSEVKSGAVLSFVCMTQLL